MPDESLQAHAQAPTPTLFLLQLLLVGLNEQSSSPSSKELEAPVELGQRPTRFHV